MGFNLVFWTPLTYNVWLKHSFFGFCIKLKVWNDITLSFIMFRVNLTLSLDFLEMCFFRCL